MQPHDVGRVDAALEDLKIIAFLLKHAVGALIIRYLGEFELRQRRRFLGRPHVSPDDSTVFNTGITGVMNRITELLLRWNIRHLHAHPVSRVLPAMIGAADAIILDAT